MNATGLVNSPSRSNVPPNTSIIPAAWSNGVIVTPLGIPPNHPNIFIAPGQKRMNPATILSSDWVAPAMRFMLGSPGDDSMRDTGWPVAEMHADRPGIPGVVARAGPRLRRFAGANQTGSLRRGMRQHGGLGAAGVGGGGLRWPIGLLTCSGSSRRACSVSG